MLDEGDWYIEESIKIDCELIGKRTQHIEDECKKLKEDLQNLENSVKRREIISAAPVYPAQINWHKYDELQPDPASEVLIVSKGHVYYAYYNVNFIKGLWLPRFFTEEPFERVWFPKSVDYWSYLPLPPQPPTQ